jgi:hypothetical protein
MKHPYKIIAGPNGVGKTTFTNFTGKSAMNGPSMTHQLTYPDQSSGDVAEGLKNDLLSGDTERQRIAASCVRAALHAREVARATHTHIVATVNGRIQRLDPDSPHLKDLTELLAIADRVVPLDGDRL